MENIRILFILSKQRQEERREERKRYRKWDVRNYQEKRKEFNRGFMVHTDRVNARSTPVMEIIRLTQLLNPCPAELQIRKL